MEPVRIIARYTVKEFCGSFLASILGFAIMVLAGQIFLLTDIVIANKVTSSVILLLLSYKVPEAVSQSLPVAALFGTVLCLSRMARDNELTVIRAGGARFARLIFPLVVIGILLSLVSFWLADAVVPRANHRFEGIVQQIIRQGGVPPVSEKVFFKGGEGLFLYAGRVDPNAFVMYDVIVYDSRAGAGKFPRIITAKAASFEDGLWYLKDGVIHNLDGEGYVSLETKFENLATKGVDRSALLAGEQRTSAGMTRAELKRHIDLFRASGLAVRSLVVDYYLKFALPFAGLVFILVGAPLAVKYPRSGRLSGIIVAIVLAFLYYGLTAWLRSLGSAGALAPIAAAWVTNIVFAGLGMFLTVRSDRLLLAFWGALLLLSLSMFTPVAAAGEAGGVPSSGVPASLKADEVRFDLESRVIIATGHAELKYKDVRITGAVIKVYLDEKKVVVTRASATGCDLLEPHYHVEADEMVLFIEDRVIVENVSYWEGRYKVFTLPSLILSLREDNGFQLPRIGRTAADGWYIKTAYNYHLANGMRGSLYLDYFEARGIGGGIKQFFGPGPLGEGYLYFYNRGNTRTFFTLSQKTDKSNTLVTANVSRKGEPLPDEVGQATLRHTSFLSETLKFTANASQSSETPPGQVPSRLLNYDLSLTKTGLWLGEVPLAVRASFGQRMERHIDHTDNGDREGDPATLASTYTGVRLESPRTAFPLGKGMSLLTSGGFTVDAYGTGDIRYMGDMKIGLTKDLAPGLTASADYRMQEVAGRSPFVFDDLSSSDLLEGTLKFSRPGLTTSVTAGYSFKESDFKETKVALEVGATEGTKLALGAGFDPDTGTVKDVTIKFQTGGVGEAERESSQRGFSLKVAGKYDARNQVLSRIESEVDWKVSKAWRIELAGAYDGTSDKLVHGDLAITRDLHCREVKLVYRGVEREVWLEYRFKILPFEPFKLGLGEDGVLLGEGG